MPDFSGHHLSEFRHSVYFVKGGVTRGRFRWGDDSVLSFVFFPGIFSLVAALVGRVKFEINNKGDYDSKVIGALVKTPQHKKVFFADNFQIEQAVK